MKRSIAPLLVGLALLSVSLAASATHAEVMNPREAVVKAITPTPAQVKKLDALKVTMDKKTGAFLQTIEATYTKKVWALAQTAKYETQFQEALKLPEDEQPAAKQKIWDAINEETRPALVKEMFTTLRGLAVTYFEEVAKLATAKQKPKLAKARAAVLANFDKELPGQLEQMTSGLSVDKKE